MVDFQYVFLRPGEVVEPRRGYVYLDLGNRKEPGVVDHHFAEYEGDSFECTASLLVAEPSLVTEWICDEDLEGTVHLCVHTQPDFDCVASTWLVSRLLTAKALGLEQPEGWDEWAPLVARTARRIDQGRTGIRLGEDGKPALSVYLAVLGVIDLVQESPRKARQGWRQVLVEGHRMLARAVELAVAEKLTDLGSLDLRGRLGELAAVEAQVDRRLEAFRRDAERLGLVPGDAPRQPLDGLAEIDLPDRRDLSSIHTGQRVAFLTDPESGGLFKSLIRGIYRKEVQATCVFTSCPEDPFTGSPAWTRPILSVDPESPFSLRGLGRLLENREKARRAELALPRIGPPRPGYDNPDPWFDGRSFDYTIVDAPNRGTVLAPGEVREALLHGREWHRLSLEDVVGRAPQLLRTPLLTAAERSRAFRDLAGATVSLSRTETPFYRVAVEELLCILRRSDLPQLGALDLDALRPFALGLLEHPDPAFRTWTLRRVVLGKWRELEALLSSLDRGDLSLVIRLAAAHQLSKPEQKSLAHRLQGGRMSRERLGLLDALATFESDPPPALQELARELCTRAAEFPAARGSLLNLARELSGTGSPVEAWAAEAAQTLGPARPVVDPVLDDEAAAAWGQALCEVATAGEVGDLDRRGRRLEAAFQARIEDGDLVGAARCLSLLSDREGLLSGVPASPGWRDQPQEEKTRRRERIAADHRTVVTRLARLLLLETEAREAERAQELTTSLAETLTRLLRLYGLRNVLADLGAVDLTGLPGIPSWGELLARRAFGGPSEWLLWRALDEAVQPGGCTPSRIVPREPREHALRVLLHRFARAAARQRSFATGDDTPACVLPTLCRRLRPIVRQRLAEWTEVEALRRIPELLDGVEELYRDRTSTAATSETPLCELSGVVREELRYQLARTGLLEATSSALGRAEILFLGRRLLASAPDSPAARIAGELIDWALHLPAEDRRPRAEELLALRHQLPLEEPAQEASRRAAEAVEWALSCLEEVVEGLEGEGSEPSLEAGELRCRVRACRVRLQEQPPGGLARLVAVALEDVATCLERKLEVLERVERAEQARDVENVADLTIDVLESSVFDKLGPPGEDADTTEEERIRLQRAISAAGDRGDRGEAFSRLLAQASRRLSKRQPLQSATAGLETLAPPEPRAPEASEEKGYHRLKSLHPLDPRFTDRILRRAITWLVDEYELDRARDLVDLHRLRPMGGVLRFWLSGYIVFLPVAFLPLFLASRLWSGWEVGLALEAFGVGVLTLTGGVIGREVRTLLRGSSAASAHDPAPCRTAGPRRQAMLSRLTLQLFLPQLLTAMVVGVVGIAFTNELDERAAIHLGDGHLMLLTVMIAVLSCEALGQLARHRGRRPPRGKLWIATARLFTYAFFMVMTLQFFLPPLTGIKVPPDSQSLLIPAQAIPGWPCLDPVCKPLGPATSWIPLEIRTPASCGRIAYYPRHLMLYSALGMFAGIFVNVLFRGNDREPAS